MCENEKIVRSLTRWGRWKTWSKGFAWERKANWERCLQNLCYCVSNAIFPAIVCPKPRVNLTKLALGSLTTLKLLNPRVSNTVLVRVPFSANKRLRLKFQLRSKSSSRFHFDGRIERITKIKTSSVVWKIN